MTEIILVIDILAAVGVVGLVLLQQGKGADMGAAFGSGASATLFGSRGTANFLTRATAILAVVFFLANVALAYLATQRVQPRETLAPAALEQPAAPVPARGDLEPASAPKVPEVPK
jgi:preprotein translocase subunit SecG